VDSSVFHQCHYAGSPEFERGLLANLVAKRCSVLPTGADRQLIWFIHYLSHQPGGLAAVAADLMAQFPDRFGTTAMVAINKTEGVYSADEVRKIRSELPTSLRDQFPLQGEFNPSIRDRAWYCRQIAESARAVLEDDESSFEDRKTASRQIEDADEAEKDESADAAIAQKLPVSYPVKSFLQICCSAAKTGFVDGCKTLSLEKTLAEICLDPAFRLDSWPWYFNELVNVLDAYQKYWIKNKSNWVMTSVGKKVCEFLDYTLDAGVLSLLIGRASLGQTFAARAWCENHPGQTRMVEVPPSNDDASFYRAIAQAIGLGNFLNYKNVQIRERIEFVLQTGNLLLVLNQAQRLWPQKNLREAFPGRLAWVLDQADKGAKVCMISGPQFFMQQRACEKMGWNSPELRNRILHYSNLPDSLGIEDLQAVARVMLPEADETSLAAVAIYSLSGRYLAALEAVAKRAQFVAQQNGRSQRTSSDVRAALKFVSGSDALLIQSSSETKPVSGRGRNRQPTPAFQTEIEVPIPGRHSQPAPAAPPTRAAFTGSAELSDLIQS
jgi:hypothetical protein